MLPGYPRYHIPRVSLIPNSCVRAAGIMSNRYGPQRVSPIPNSPGISNTEFLRPRCRDHATDPGGETCAPGIPDTSGVPTLINGPVMGLWPRTCSTHPLSEAYHRCCCTPPGLLTNNMNFCELFLFPVFFPFNSNLMSLSLSIFRSSLPLLHPQFRHLNGPNTGTL